MERIEYKKIDEIIYKEILDNGLEVVLIPKTQFNKTYVSFTTKYGSIDNHFKPIGRNELVKVPDGIAHYLEHKMFEMPDGTDAFKLLSEYGASANAFTSFERTSYYFTCTSHLDKNIEILLNYVQTPHFTDENVEKEQGIIQQEIKMYDDDADWQSYFGLIRNLYKEHPINIDIAGTVESIAKINKEYLYTCYNTFYHPSNMQVIVCGNFDKDEVINVIRQNQSSKSFEKPFKLERKIIVEDTNVVVKNQVRNMNIQTPKLSLGIKHNYNKLTGNKKMLNEIAFDILLELYFGTSSDEYEKLKNDNLINDTFGYETMFIEGCTFTVIDSNTTEPEMLEKRLKQAIEKLSKYDFDESYFEEVRNSMIGKYLRTLNSLEKIASNYNTYSSKESDYFKMLDVLENITKEDVLEIRKEFNVNSVATLIVKNN